MLTLWGAREQFCDGLSRRGFLKIGAFGAGLTLADMLRLRALGFTPEGKTTNVSGVQICEHMPLQAKMWDKLACIRSIISVGEHSDSLVMTGYSARDNETAKHPSFGSVVPKLRSGDASSVPPFV